MSGSVPRIFQGERREQKGEGVESPKANIFQLFTGKKSKL